jgi:hypothetical protein
MMWLMLQLMNSTHDTLSDPYDTLPSGWTNEVNYVQSLNGGSL